MYKKIRKFLCDKFKLHWDEVVDLPEPYDEFKCKICGRRTSLVVDLVYGEYYEEGFSWEEYLSKK